MTAEGTIDCNTQGEGGEKVRGLVRGEGGVDGEVVKGTWRVMGKGEAKKRSEGYVGRLPGI